MLEWVAITVPLNYDQGLYQQRLLAKQSILGKPVPLMVGVILHSSLNVAVAPSRRKLVG
jgi:hypothetical protein